MLITEPEFMPQDKNYSWKGSWNAGLVLLILALVGGALLIFSGFGG